MLSSQITAQNMVSQALFCSKVTRMLSFAWTSSLHKSFGKWLFIFPKASGLIIDFSTLNRYIFTILFYISAGCLFLGSCSFSLRNIFGLLAEGRYFSSRCSFLDWLQHHRFSSCSAILCLFGLWILKYLVDWWILDQACSRWCWIWAKPFSLW